MQEETDHLNTSGSALETPPDATDQPELVEDEGGATMLEYVLLVAVIALPSFFLIKLSLEFLTDYYQMQTMINSLPFP